MTLPQALASKTRGPGRWLLRAALAYAALLSLRVYYETATGLETGNRLTDAVSRIPNAFYTDPLPDLLLFGAILLLLCLVGDREERPDGWTLALAFVFACCLSICSVCRDLGNFSFFFANGFQVLLSLFVLFGQTVFFYPILRVLLFLMEEGGPPAGERPLRRPMRSAALIMLLSWLPWLLMNYPCSFNGDSIYQLAFALGSIPWSAHHPPLNTAIIWLCVSLGKAVRDVNFGCFLYVVLQSVTGALLFSACMAELLRMGMSRRGWIALLLFFAATPMWGCFAQWLEKDYLYAQAFTLELLLLLPVLRERSCSGKRALVLTAVALVAVLLRKTGLWELIPALLAIGFWLRERSRLRLLCAALAVILLSSAVNDLLYPALGIKPASIGEALSLPFQQTARYVNEFPDEVTEEERTAIDAVLDYEKLDQYNPVVSDPVKNNFRKDNSALPAYFRTWLRMFLKHPVCYFEAAFMLSYGYLAPVDAKLDAVIQTSYYPVSEELGVYRVFGDFPTRLFDSIREIFIEFPLTILLCMAGFYTWILLLCLTALLRRKRGSACLLLIAGLMDVLVCVASPLWAATRYELPVIASTPLILGWTILQLRQPREAEE